jgi:hypothetical protein
VLNLPEGAVIYARKLYPGYHCEDLLQEIDLAFKPLEPVMHVGKVK